MHQENRKSSKFLAILKSQQYFMAFIMKRVTPSSGKKRLLNSFLAADWQAHNADGRRETAGIQPWSEAAAGLNCMPIFDERAIVFLRLNVLRTISSIFIAGDDHKDFAPMRSP
jgi:hypothetical protein